VNPRPIVNCDYKSRTSTSPKPATHPLIRYRWPLIATAIVTITITLSLATGDAEAMRSNSATEISQAQQPNIPLALPRNDTLQQLKPVEQTTPLATQPQPQIVRVNSGDSLSVIFSKQGISARQLQEIVALGEQSTALTRLYPGDELRLTVSDEGQLQALQYDIDDAQTLDISRLDGRFQATIIQHPLETRVRHVHGIINSSLFLSAQRAGLSDNLTMKLAGIFGWDIDFALDIRQGDHFSVIYDEIFRDGEKIRDGDIHVAEFSNRKHTYSAVRYTDASNRTDYYTPEGMSMRKAFLRTPVEFSRISSRFSLHRKHPVLNRIRAHKGVDYAAPRGTPIKATGDGKVVFRGTKGGYGKAIILQHGQRYTTLYGHMSRFAKGIRNGKRVRQGQTIGYIGSSGLATGPHLHYEFRLNGVHRNPLTVKFPEASPIDKRYRDDFLAQAKQAMARLALLQAPQQLSMNSAVR